LFHVNLTEPTTTVSGDKCASVHLHLCCQPLVERILQGVDIVPVGVSSMLSQSSPLVQFAVSVVVTLVRSRNHCKRNAVDLMNVVENAWLTVSV